MSVSPLDRLLSRDPAAIARALSMVESERLESADLIRHLDAHTGRALVIGITGPPGVGKSTLVDRLITEYRRTGQQVGVLAVDPTSPFSGGALLGDRVRMQAHAGDSGVFIRSMATRGAVGGLGRATAAAAHVLDAAGFDVVLVETVGVGQHEIDVARITDVVIVVLAPGAGDEIQAGKAGLMEIADLFVVNKADRDDADRTASSIETELSLGSFRAGSWRPFVLKTVATTGSGVAEVTTAIERFRKEAASTIEARRIGRARASLSAAQVAVDHVAIAVSDPTVILDFLGTNFGIASDAPAASLADGVQIRFLETAGARLELVEPTSQTSRIAAFLAKRGPGLHHVALRVGNLSSTLASLKARGVRLIDESPRKGAHGTTIAFIHPASTGGVLIELIADEEIG